MVGPYQLKSHSNNGGDNGHLNDQSAEITRQQLARPLQNGLNLGHQLIRRDGFNHVAKERSVFQEEKRHEDHGENPKEETANLGEQSAYALPQFLEFQGRFEFFQNVLAVAAVVPAEVDGSKVVIEPDCSATGCGGQLIKIEFLHRSDLFVDEGGKQLNDAQRTAEKNQYADCCTH